MRREIEEEEKEQNPNPPATPETKPSTPEGITVIGARFEIVTVGVNTVQLNVNVTGMSQVWCMAVKEFSAPPLKEVQKEKGHEVRAEESGACAEGVKCRNVPVYHTRTHSRVLL